MKFAATCALLAVQAVLLPSAHAGEFSVFCTYSNQNLSKCANAISDLVTDKFIAKFPPSKYQIFMHSNIHSYTNGGYAAYAIAGVIPKGSAQFPVVRYSNTDINGSDKKFGAIALAEKELDVYRAAAKSLMDACELSPTCDVFTDRTR